MNQRHKIILFTVFILLATNLSFAMYDTHTGRFMQQDPLGTLQGGYLDGMNLYQYVKDNSLLGLDPSGLMLSYKYGFNLPPLPNSLVNQGKENYTTYNTIPFHTADRKTQLMLLNIKRKAWEVVIGGRAKGYKQAPEFLGHYLNCRATSKNFEVRDLVYEVEDVRRRIYTQDINNAMSFIERKVPIGVPIVSEEWEYYKPTYNKTKLTELDWKRSIQDFTAAAKATNIRCWGSGGKTYYQMDYTYFAEDVYYWMKGSSLSFKGLPFGETLAHWEIYLLHQYGIGRIFSVHGKPYTYTVKWQEGQRVGREIKISAK